MSASEILGEIIQGVSEIPLNGDVYFFKHPSVADRLCISKIEAKQSERGKLLGFLPKEDMVKKAIESGKWSDELEEETSKLKWLIAAEKRNLKKFSEPSLISELEGSIKRHEEEIESLANRRAKLSVGCLEDYVSSKLPAELCRQELYVDDSFSRSVDDETARKLLYPYIKKISDLTDRDSLLKAAYQSSFFDLFFIYDSLDKVFDKNIYSLSIFQKELMGYGRVLYSKLTKIPNIPDGTKNDPLKLYFYEEKMTEKENETNLRKYVESKGGPENMTAEDKLT